MQEEAVVTEIVLANGHVVAMESVREGSAARDVSLREKISFADLLGDVEELCSMLLQSLRVISPTEAEIELSLGVEAGSGRLMAFMVDGKASGAVALRLKWEKRDA